MHLVPFLAFWSDFRAWSSFVGFVFANQLVFPTDALNLLLDFSIAFGLVIEQVPFISAFTIFE